MKFIEKDRQQKSAIEQIVFGLEERIVSEKKRRQKQEAALKFYFVSNKPDLLELDIHFQSPALSEISDEIPNQEGFREKLKSVLREKLRL